MQFLIKRSKFLVFAVLGCLLWFVWFGSNSNAQLVGETANFLPVGSIWNNMSGELKLDHKTESHQVQVEIRRLLADQDNFYRILKAAGPYIYYIYEQTQALGLPAELALIPVIESEFNPNDHSSKGATGLWQLMPQTAHDLGIKIKSSYDGRRNVMASTKAALAYFSDLGDNFNGNWYLAIAAYNCGQVRIESAERRAGSSSFWNLRLPRETTYYVPRLLAVAAIIKNPEKYGVKLPETQNKPYFAEVETPKAVNLQKIAQTSGVDMKTLHTLNPDYNHGTIVPNKKGKYSVLVPVNKAPIVKAQLPGSTVNNHA